MQESTELGGPDWKLRGFGPGGLWPAKGSALWASDACLAPTGFAVGWGPIPWLLMSEIFPLHVKGLATGVCVLTNWFMAFLVTKEFSSVMVSAGPEGLLLM